MGLIIIYFTVKLYVFIENHELNLDIEWPDYIAQQDIHD